jgi:hypothetical protein
MSRPEVAVWLKRVLSQVLNQEQPLKWWTIGRCAKHRCELGDEGDCCGWNLNVHERFAEIGVW